jgi:invasion protein IalB
MVSSMHRGKRLSVALGRALLLAGVGCVALGTAVPLAMAQQAQTPVAKTPQKTTQAPQAAPPAAPPAAPAPAAAPAGEVAPPPGQEQAAWVKLCEKSAQTENKEICLTNHERLDGNSGMVLVGAAVRKIEGEEKQQLLVKLPQAALLAIPAGVQIKVDDGQPIALGYTFCYAMSCQAETDLTKELFESMRKGKQMLVAVVNLQGKAIGLPVPLAGFAKAYDGPPVDTAKYQEARRQVMEQIRQRQIELANKAKQAAPAEGQAQAGATTPPAPAPTPNATAQPKTPAQ